MDLLAQDPAAGYLQIYKGQFAAEAGEFFDAAVREGRIDPELNAENAAELRKLLAQQEHLSGKKGILIFFLILLLIALAGWGIWIYNGVTSEEQPLHWGIFIACAAGGVLLIFGKMLPAIKNLSARVVQLQQEIDALHTEIRNQLAPLFDFFDWDTLTDLFSRIITPVKFDKFLPQERLDDLRENFGFQLEDEPDSTLTGAFSGTFYGYPFVFTEDLDFAWGEKTWSGSITIYYQERIRGADGKYQWVTRSQVLTASVTKPCPEFTIDRNFFFGHDAAPHLSFSRSPSSLSGGEGFWNKLGKKYKMRKLRKFEQNLEDDSQYTMVSNHEFEVLFQSENRDHEIEFRLLYTPLAQQYMVNLLNDREGGYGDDFAYIKSNCVTRICSQHQNEQSLSEPPFYSENFDLSEIRAQFLDHGEKFFRSLYFTLAPLFLVPAYNEPRLGVEEEENSDTISMSEIEGGASSHAEYFIPEESITENIFNVVSSEPIPGGVQAVIESIGFAGCEHTEYISRYGADGNWHDVPVVWIEYIPVSRRTPLLVYREKEFPGDRSILFRRRSLIFCS